MSDGLPHFVSVTDEVFHLTADDEQQQQKSADLTVFEHEARTVFCIELLKYAMANYDYHKL